MRVHILDDWFDTLKNLPCFELLSESDVTIWTDHVQDAGQLAERLQPAEALVLFRERTKISAELVEKLPKLKLISQRSVYPHIDIEACTKNNILVSSNMHKGTPSFAAAEHTFALILASYRQIVDQVNSIRAGEWQMGVGRTLRGKTLGLYGYGRITKALVDYAKAFGVEVQIWGSEDGRSRAISDGLNVPKSREEFFATSDIVSVHVRLKPETTGLITAQDLAHLNDRALFVNTSRAGIVEKDALEQEVLKNRIFVATDVFDIEPLHNKDHILLSHPHVTPTPHIGYVTEDEFELQFKDIFEQIVAFKKGAPIHMINPEVWGG